MSKKEIMSNFVNKINDKKMMTLFIKNIFGYDNFTDYNYLFRIIEDSKKIILDIYDNVSDHRFNRYIFNFGKGSYDIKTLEDKNVFVSWINVLSVEDSDNKLLKLAYLFKIRKNLMIKYAESFLDKEIVLILEDIIKKPI